MKKISVILLGLLTFGLVAVAAALWIPAIREPVFFQLNELRVKVQYALNPPEEAVFVPESQLATIVQATMLAQVTPTPTVTPQPTATVPGPTPTLTPTPTPLPAAVNLTGVRYIDQHGLWNYCAPSTLAMALTYWGWQGERTDVGPVVKPFDKDKNVMPYELADYVHTNTQFKAVVRVGGTLELLKRLVAEQFVVLIEKGIWLKDYNGKLGWVGHYAVITGYDDAKREFMTQDAYYSADYIVTYDDLFTQWRDFNYTYLVIYPENLRTRLNQVLGTAADETASYRAAAQMAADETLKFTGIQQFYAWFNRGSSLVNLLDYTGAAAAYDQAFSLMASLPQDERPWRMMWYQTGPYFAYYYSGRYEDVISLADNTIKSAAEPYLEESFVWRARAKMLLGDTAGAADDVRKSLEYHPGFGPSLELAAQLGIQQ